MQILLVALSLGAFSSAFWPFLPPLWASVVLITLCIPFLTLGPRASVFIGGLIAFLSGVLWATVWGMGALEHQLSADLDKTDYRVHGVVTGLPDRDARRVKFDFRVLGVEALGTKTPGIKNSGLGSTSLPKVPPLRKLVLSWYGAEDLSPGQEWQFEVRLRQPRGFANPGGFDYRAWLFRSGVSATGYVRKSEQNQQISNTDIRASRLGITSGIDQYRYRVASHIQQLELGNEARALLTALTVGDKRSIPPATWQVLQSTGTIHLAVISGLHIGLAALVGIVLGNGFGRLLCRVGWSLPAPQLGLVLGWVSGLVYTSLSGFSLPTLRAFIMLSVLVLMALRKRNVGIFSGVLWAWTIVSLVEPLAMLSPGFWLSFMAVIVLMGYFRGRVDTGESRQARPFLLRIKQLVLAQWALLLGLGGLLIFFQGELSLLSPLANVLAVPWIGFVVVPLCLLGIGLFAVYEPWADLCWQFAGGQLEWFATALTWLSAYESISWVPAMPGGLLLALSLICGSILLMCPRGLSVRLPGIVLIVAVVWAGRSAPNENISLAVTVLDVGQGLAVVVETADGTLVYDTGSRFSERFDIGSGVIAPYLRSRGYTDLRMLVVSHSDGDHSGGVRGLLRHYQPDILLTGSPESRSRYTGLDNPAVQQRCGRGMGWRWGEVGFHILHPAPEQGPTKPGLFSVPRSRAPQNNNSCVLLIRYRDQDILLTGDIEKAVETQLLKAKVLPSKVALLLAPHHGSKTSSSTAFVEHLAPEHVVYSAGYRHHFGHPYVAVVARYELSGAQQWNTAYSGAIRFEWGVDGKLSIQRGRERTSHYWQEPSLEQL